MSIPNDCTKSFDTLNETCSECVYTKETCPYQNKSVDLTRYEIQEEWFGYYLDELKALKTEYRQAFTDMLMDFKHAIGTYVAEAINEHSKSDNYGKKIVQDSAKHLNMGVRDLYYCISFASKWKKLDDCPASDWTEAKKLLDGREKKKECRHKHTQMIEVCSDCNKRIST